MTTLLSCSRRILINRQQLLLRPSRCGTTRSFGNAAAAALESEPVHHEPASDHGPPRISIENKSMGQKFKEKRGFTSKNHDKSQTTKGWRYLYRGQPIEMPYIKDEYVYPGQPSFRDGVPLGDLDLLHQRHIGPDAHEVKKMLDALGEQSMDSFVESVIPGEIQYADAMDIGTEHGVSETAMIEEFDLIADETEARMSMIGLGYYNTKVPEVIRRNILECPEWYTSYTPYQAEISQGRLESLINFQTMVTSLTGLDIANASVLDELTAAAEAMTFAYASLPASKQKSQNKVFLVSDKMFTHIVSGLYPRAEGFDIKIVIADFATANLDDVIGDAQLVGAMVQYPDVNANTADWLPSFTEDIHKRGGVVCCGTDLLSLTKFKPPGEWGADVCFGSAQRFGVPMGLGGPHAGFFATKDTHKRKMPGRLIGASKDRLGDKAYRLALQTREQHIRRERATSNICTAQALLANMAAMYAVYHGPKGLSQIAEKIISSRQIFVQTMRDFGWPEDLLIDSNWDTVHVGFTSEAARRDFVRWQNDAFPYVMKVNIGDKPFIRLSFDECTSYATMMAILKRFVFVEPGPDVKLPHKHGVKPVSEAVQAAIQKVLDTGKMGKPSQEFARTTPFLEQEVFNTHHSETEMLRYIHHLQSKDLSLAHTMIPLGSCTMKLNATTEMLPLSNPKFGNLHPFLAFTSYERYGNMIHTLEKMLAKITGFDAVSVQPNSGAQGEFTGLRMIRNYLRSIGQAHRDTILIPVSAHGTNPASATMVGYKVQAVKCDPKTGNLDIADLEEKAKKLGDKLAGAMITYPSTYGVFEPAIKQAIQIVHAHGGQVYMDGANMNAQVGLTSPGYLGADVCHLNLHKTFCIPHGGGGPGVGPVCVKSHLAPFLPSHDGPLFQRAGADKTIGPVSTAPFGSASILPISYSYIKMMGSKGLKHATSVGLLNANYMAQRLSEHYPILYTNANGRCAHEFILDVRPLKETSGVEAVDIAKRLMDYGFHAPTMSWPVPGTLMIEPTESESLGELDRYCDALIEIRKEIKAIEDGQMDKKVNPLKMAPHPIKDLVAGDEAWKDRGYTREQAAYPLPYLKEKKFWPSVARVDDAYGDTNLFCTCDPMPQEA